ncbi:hypothetical protein O181_045714 [Austropuccinia psidii MF-1]|uniref:Retrotransposon gag domain-containing protein n=1 Tax=Austropuccinia psidii MF-1 TaxID=1389203 RepID=A0A9Q3DMK1_9BASI|nr:hypothetical protein [Austropuccinia psidii MF-1]
MYCLSSIIPVQHSPPDKNTRSQRHQAVFTPTARAPLYCTPLFHQLSTNLDRGPPMEGAASCRRGGPRSRSGEADDEEGEESVEEEEPEETEVEAAPEASETPNLAPSNQPPVSQAEPNFLKMMEQMTKFMGKLTQAVAQRDTSRVPAFKTQLMDAPDSFDGTKPYKLRVFIQSCQLIFDNDPENFFSKRKKVLYSNSFLTVRAGKWIEPYLSNISNEDPFYFLNNWKLVKTQLFTLFGDPNEVRKAEQELENLRMKERGQVSLYIADLRSLMSRIGDLGKGPIFMCIEKAWHQDCWTNWLLTLETLIAFKSSWTLLWNHIVGTMRGRRKMVFIKRKSLQLVDPTLTSLPKVHLQKCLITQRT